MAIDIHEQSLFDLIKTFSADDCVEGGGPAWRSWGAWIIDNPWFLQSLHDGLVEEGFSIPQCEKALTNWLQQSLSGSSSISRGHIEAEDGAIWWDVETLNGANGEPAVVQMQVSHTPAMPPSNNSSKSDDDCAKALAKRDRHLLLFHPASPVLLATHHPQVDADEDYSYHQKLPDLSTHLAIDSFVSAAPAHRNALIGTNSQASDRLLDDPLAPDRARSYPGPFYYTAVLLEPAECLRAVRSRVLLSATPDSTSSMPKPGPRF